SALASPGSAEFAPPAGTIALRAGGWRCWVCGQMGTAGPPGTANLCCDGCAVRRSGGTRRLRRGKPAFKQREFTWWVAGKRARDRDLQIQIAEYLPAPAARIVRLSVYRSVCYGAPRGGWAVSGTGSFSRGWLPASGGW